MAKHVSNPTRKERGAATKEKMTPTATPTATQMSVLSTTYLASRETGYSIVAERPELGVRGERQGGQMEAGEQGYGAEP